MTISEFSAQYYFHDSVLENLNFYDDKLKMRCTFCNFMQKNYQNNQFSNSEILVIFYHASYKITGEIAVNNAVFLNQKTRENKIDFFLESNNGEYGNLSVKAELVEVIRLRSYNL